MTGQFREFGFRLEMIDGKEVRAAQIRLRSLTVSAPLEEVDTQERTILIMICILWRRLSSDESGQAN